MNKFQTYYDHMEKYNSEIDKHRKIINALGVCDTPEDVTALMQRHIDVVHDSEFLVRAFARRLNTLDNLRREKLLSYVLLNN